jgi:hypothetical protein
LVSVKVPFVLPVVPTRTVPRLKLVDENCREPAVPLRATNCGLVGSESLMVSVSVKVPVTVG